jgi:membrane protease YdiL (CAAX protease family)
MIHIALPQDTAGIIAYFIVGGIVAPITEELFFRGFVYGFFRRWGVLAGVLLSTAFFGLAHPGVSVVQITGGIVFALAYEREKCLTTPIVIHSLGNLALFSIALLA